MTCDPSSPATHCGKSDCTDYGCMESDEQLLKAFINAYGAASRQRDRYRTALEEIRNPERCWSIHEAARTARDALRGDS